jgi:Uri superfamily endonuclease
VVTGDAAADAAGQPGTYVLVVRSPATGAVRVGRLGSLALDGRWLLYVGSALGPGGLRARVGRHVAGARAVHWHVDRLLRSAEVVEVWLGPGEGRREESWARTLRAAPGASVPLPGFGASDCGCAGHLVAFEARPRVQEFRGWLREAGAEVGKLVAVKGSRRLGTVFGR